MGGVGALKDDAPPDPSTYAKKRELASSIFESLVLDATFKFSYHSSLLASEPTTCRNLDCRNISRHPILAPHADALLAGALKTF